MIDRVVGHPFVDYLRQFLIAEILGEAQTGTVVDYANVDHHLAAVVLEVVEVRLQLGEEIVHIV